MIVRVFFLIFLGVLETVWVGCEAREVVTVAETERLAGFEAAEETAAAPEESRAIFVPLSPIVVEAEPVKLPADETMQ